MGSASLQFVGFSLAVVIVFNLGRSIAWRQAILLIASLSFLAFFSLNPVSWLPLIGFLTFGFVSLRRAQTQSGRGGLMPVIVAGVVAFVWLKKYSFVPSALLLHFPYVALGLSYIFFRVLHLIIDAKDGNIPDEWV